MRTVNERKRYESILTDEFRLVDGDIQAKMLPVGGRATWRGTRWATRIRASTGNRLALNRRRAGRTLGDEDDDEDMAVVVKLGKSFRGR